MEPTIHKVDPNGDTLLILRNPNAPFAGDATVWPDALPKYRADRLKRNERELEPIAQVEHPTPDGPREVHFQLSSKHLALASRYFRALVANRWKEASSSCGFAYTVTAEDWDEAALLMVMKIIHCQTSEIPQDIDSEMVAKMTVIVDYYQCTKAISFYVDIWMKNFDSRELSCGGYKRKLLLRLFISQLFFNASDFQRCTQVIIRESRGPIHSLGLPFPQNLIDALEDERKNRISQVIAALHKLTVGLIQRNEACSRTCSLTSACFLINTMRGLKLSEPRPAPPFVGYSLAAMKNALSKVEWPILRGLMHCNYLPGCDMEGYIEFLFHLYYDGVDGLNLGAFVDMRKKT